MSKSLSKSLRLLTVIARSTQTWKDVSQKIWKFLRLSSGTPRKVPTYTRSVSVFRSGIQKSTVARMDRTPGIYTAPTGRELWTYGKLFSTAPYNLTEISATCRPLFKCTGRYWISNFTPTSQCYSFMLHDIFAICFPPLVDFHRFSFTRYRIYTFSNAPVSLLISFENFLNSNLTFSKDCQFQLTTFKPSLTRG